MESITILRNNLGLSQANLAIYLSVSVSLIKMAEAGKRELPTNAALKLAKLQQVAFGKKKDKQANLLPASKNDAYRELSRYISQYEGRINKLQRQLADMQNGYQQAANSLVVATELLKKMRPGKEDVPDRLWLELLQADASAMLNRSGWGPQSLLRWKIDCYAYTINSAKDVLNTGT